MQDFGTFDSIFTKFHCSKFLVEHEFLKAAGVCFNGISLYCVLNV